MRKNRLFLTKKPIVLIWVVIVLLCGVVGQTVAWLVQNFTYSKTENLEITTPPAIYLKDDKMQNISSFHLDGLKVGVEYNAVFCVAPAIYNSISTFYLGLIYTQNMGMNINLYPIFSVTESAASGEGVCYEKVDITQGSKTYNCYFNFYKSNETTFENEVLNGYTVTKTYGNWNNSTPPTEDGSGDGIILNSGIFQKYSGLKFSGSQTASSDLFGQLNDTSRYRYFVLNITWDEDVDFNNVEEVDVVYIISQEETIK